MTTGDLKHRVTIEAPVKTPDGAGGFTTSYSTIATVYAAIWPVSASEQVQAMQATMTITHKITIRYRSVLKGSWRLKYGNKYYSIVSIINPNMDNKFLTILAKEAA